jgi:TctA family transporter
MTERIDQNRRQMLALTGKAGLTTLTAQAIGVNLGLVGVAAAQGANRISTAVRTMSSTNNSKTPSHR